MGIATGLGCNGSSEIYSVPGVRSTKTVMTEDGNLAVAKRPHPGGRAEIGRPLGAADIACCGGR